MRFFTANIKTRTDKKTMKKSLDSLLNKSEETFFVFPFCLFSKFYYSSLRKGWKRPYNGHVTENEFEFKKTIGYGNISSGGSTSRQLTIKGIISEEMGFTKAQLEFQLSTFDIIFNLILIFGFLIVSLIYRNAMFIAIPIVIILDAINFTLKNYLKIRKRLNKGI